MEHTDYLHNARKNLLRTVGLFNASDIYENIEWEEKAFESAKNLTKEGIINDYRYNFEGNFNTNVKFFNSLIDAYTQKETLLLTKDVPMEDDKVKNIRELLQIQDDVNLRNYQIQVQESNSLNFDARIRNYIMESLTDWVSNLSEDRICRIIEQDFSRHNGSIKIPLSNYLKPTILDFEKMVDNSKYSVKPYENFVLCINITEKGINDIKEGKDCSNDDISFAFETEFSNYALRINEILEDYSPNCVKDLSDRIKFFYTKALDRYYTNEKQKEDTEKDQKEEEDIER